VSVKQVHFKKQLFLPPKHKALFLAKKTCAMYQYISTESKYIRELQEYNPEMVIEIAAMFPDEYSKYLSMVKQGIAAADIEMILRGVHSLKSNLKIFIDDQHEIIKYMQQIEARLRSRLETHKDSHSVSDAMAFKEIPFELEQLLREPMNEIAHLASQSHL
jgi:HPt (histidine-containing phosphotransfer) domain-containing protein